jgi:predicted benzoate:H+ symporter BenE
MLAFTAKRTEKSRFVIVFRLCHRVSPALAVLKLAFCGLAAGIILGAAHQISQQKIVLFSAFISAIFICQRILLYQAVLSPPHQ